jgi:hypothetical protein
LLSYTVINGSVLNSTDVPDGTTELTSLLGLPINVTKAGDTIALTGESSDEILAIVVDADRNATNGVIHGINAGTRFSLFLPSRLIRRPNSVPFTTSARPSSRFAFDHGIGDRNRDRGRKHHYCHQR